MESQVELPFPTMSMEKKRYKIFGIVTNRDIEGDELIHWLHKRCGKSEEAHGVMKEDLAGGKLPSSHFGENAAWWWIMILAFNLNAAMKRLVLEESWVAKRMKAIRFSLIGLPGRVIHARGLIVRLEDHPRSVLGGMRQYYGAKLRRQGSGMHGLNLNQKCGREENGVGGLSQNPDAEALRQARDNKTIQMVI
jgi:hypothetical protein